jgi:hypothetical protein
VVSVKEQMKVLPQEIAELLLERRRLAMLGKTITPVERLAYYERKANLLQRIADHPNSSVDPAKARKVAEKASRQLESMKRHPAYTGGVQR